MRTPEEYLEVAARLEREARSGLPEHEVRDFHLMSQHWLDLALRVACEVPLKSPE